MIITKNNFVFLDNPKCGSSTIRHHYYTQFKSLYKDKGYRINECKGYDDPQYRHCNLKGAVNKILSLDKNPNNFIFICPIRNPYNRIISHYNHWINKYNIKPTFDKFLYSDHLSNLFPNKFRFIKNYKINEIIKVESLHKDMEKLKNKFNLDIKIKPDVLDNKGKHNNKILFTNEHIDFINKNFKEDFEDGGYPYLTAEELNLKY